VQRRKHTPGAEAPFLAELGGPRLKPWVTSEAKALGPRRELWGISKAKTLEPKDFALGWVKRLKPLLDFRHFEGAPLSKMAIWLEAE
jgi:hypothetical protein